MPDQKTFEKQGFIVTLAGPLQTMITGTIGFILLCANYTRNGLSKFKFKQWFFAFLTFFWSRQIANFLILLFDHVVFNRFSYSGDEVKLSHYLNLPLWSLNIITAIAGTIILGWTTFRIIPKSQQMTFISAGLIGSATGFYIWMYLAGPAILP